jgi:hypothetical protein
VGPTAQVDEPGVAGERGLGPWARGRVLVGADQPGSVADMGSSALAVDDLELEAVAGEHLAGARARELVAHERLRLGQDLAHAGLDALEVLGVEGAGLAVGPRRQLEVVVEAVLDGRADGEGGTGEQLQHRLGHDVGGGVADRVEPALDVAVTISTTSPSASSQSRSRSVPLTLPITAALARPGPIDAARPPTVVPAGTARVLPSGREIVMSAIGRA